MNEGKSQGSNEIDMTINQKLQGFIKSGSMYSCTGETFSESTGNRGWPGKTQCTEAKMFQMVTDLDFSNVDQV